MKTIADERRFAMALLAVAFFVLGPVWIRSGNPASSSRRVNGGSGSTNAALSF